MKLSRREGRLEGEFPAHPQWGLVPLHSLPDHTNALLPPNRDQAHSLNPVTPERRPTWGAQWNIRVRRELLNTQIPGFIPGPCRGPEGLLYLGGVEVGVGRSRCGRVGG